MDSTAPPRRGRCFAFGSFGLDADSRELRRNGELVPLHAKPFQTLLVLLTHHDRMVGKEELIASVWPDSFVSDDSLTQSIRAVRRALGDDSGQPRFIATIPRRGYRFIAPVTVPEAETSHAHTPAASSPQARPRDPVAPPPAMPVVPAAVSAEARGPRRLGARPGVWMAISALALLALVAAVLPRGMPDVGARAVRVPVSAPPGTTLVSGAAVSPDGRYVAFGAQDDDSGRIRIWIRALDSGATRPIEGTLDGTRHFWSPDGASIGFVANGRLKTVGLTADRPSTLATVGLNPGGASWSRRGVILFAGARSGLFVVPETGGDVRAVTTLDASGRELAHRWPTFLPDGRRFLYTVVSPDPELAGTYLGAIDNDQRTRLLDASSAFATYAASHILYVRGRTLMARRFDPAAARLQGEPISVATDVAVPDFLNRAVISGSDGGVLTFGGGRKGGRLVWYDRAGALVGPVDAPGSLHNPTLSSDQRYVLADTSGERNVDRAGVWMIDLVGGAQTRVVAGSTPLWSPDASRIAYMALTDGDSHLFVHGVGRDGDRLALLRGRGIGLNDWSPDGRYIVYLTTGRDTKKDIWLLPTFGDRQPIPFVQSPSEEVQAQVSPDSRWLAYASDESGAWEVYAESFPAPGSRHIVSVGGGGEPQWRADGRELLYLAPDNTLMAVQVEATDTWRSGRPQPLFRAPIAGDQTRYRSRYAVSADGQRFLFDSTDDPYAEQVTMIVNWSSLFER